MNLLAKIGLGAAVFGIVNTLPYLERTESGLDNPYVLAAIGVGILGACAAVYEKYKSERD